MNRSEALRAIKCGLGPALVGISLDEGVQEDVLAYVVGELRKWLAVIEEVCEEVDDDEDSG